VPASTHTVTFLKFGHVLADGYHVAHNLVAGGQGPRPGSVFLDPGIAVADAAGKDLHEDETFTGKLEREIAQLEGLALGREHGSLVSLGE
jgi:hypothetical protein